MDDILKEIIGENSSCEFKEALERKQFKSWLKSVSAFANVSLKRRNPILADVFAQLNYMEKRGSGLRKICNETSRLPGFTDIKEPRFRSQASSFYTELLNNNYLGLKNKPVNNSVSDSVKVSDPVKLSLLQRDLLNEMNLNPSITRLELVERLNISLISVKRTIALLKELKLIERVGSDKSGHWVVKK